MMIEYQCRDTVAVVLSAEGKVRNTSQDRGFEDKSW
jgi:hypothetical protein